MKKIIFILPMLLTLLLSCDVISQVEDERWDENGSGITINVTPGNSQLALNWPAVTGATAYEVWYSTTNNYATATQSNGDITGTSYTIYGLINGTMYFVWVRAKNSSGTGLFSAAASGTPASSGVTSTVTFDTQGAGGTVILQVTSPATTLGTMPTVPVLAGSNFAGWYTAPGGGGTAFTQTTAVTGDITVYANWTTGGVFEITFDKNFAAATGTMAPQSIAEGASAVIATNTFANSGWNLIGWSITPAGPVNHPVGSSYTMGATGITLFAVWQATINFLPDGGTPVPGSIVFTTPNVNVNSLPTPPMKPGYEFGGWFTGVGGTGLPFVVSTNVTGSMPIYAKWIPALEYISIDALNCSVKGTGLTGAVVIPSVAPGNAGAAAGKTVVAIEANGFTGSTGITSVMIPDSVTTIGANAFNGCIFLSSVNVLSTTPPGADNTIFQGCSALGTASITVPALSASAYQAAAGWSYYHSFGKLQFL